MLKYKGPVSLVSRHGNILKQTHNKVNNLTFCAIGLKHESYLERSIIS